jgi:hypothetical protein
MTGRPNQLPRSGIPIRRHGTRAVVGAVMVIATAALGAAALTRSRALAEPRPGDASPLPLQVEISVEPGEALRRITVYLRNPTGDAVSFPTGARGGPGSLDDRRRDDIGGTAPTAVPVVRFNEGLNNCVVAAPAFGGTTRRAQAPETLSIPAGGRVSYASFVVPREYVIGKPIRVEIALPDGGRIVGEGRDLVYGEEP